MLVTTSVLMTRILPVGGRGPLFSPRSMRALYSVYGLGMLGGGMGEGEVERGGKGRGIVVRYYIFVRVVVCVGLCVRYVNFLTRY